MNIAMRYKLISHIKFRLTATNQHGVHSPFVYSFVTKSLYQPPYYKTSKSTAILLKAIDHFAIKDVQLIGDNEEIKKQLSRKDISISDSTVTLICLESVSQRILDKYVLENSEIRNGSIIYIPDIYRNKERNDFWQSIIKLEKVTVSMDMFYGGLLFFRKEQAKEEFKIRV
ncbi:hypothetical protein GCM10007383_18340 [Arenibacter certesii]|uniref:Uncharacterized protein n=2 Tax=Arenibacter certesii TaxID=228955 RepID=A0A918IWA7_9FLAO|nr:hypothetical protein GCM10007383_18340 [Arenibacter certesii]